MKSHDDAPPLLELRLWMAKTGRRQTNVAKLISVTDAEFSLYFRGLTDLDLHVVEALSRVTGIAAHLLVNDKETSQALKRLVTRAKRAGGHLPRKTQKQAQNDNVA